MNDLTEYRYSLDNGPVSTIPASADDTATITVTPATAGPHTLDTPFAFTAGQ